MSSDDEPERLRAFREFNRNLEERSARPQFDITNPGHYFAPGGFMQRDVKEHYVLVSWYATAVDIWNVAMQSGMVEDDRPPHYVNLRGSYIAHCEIAGINPEMPLVWDELYRCLRLCGISSYPTQAQLFNATNTSWATLNEARGDFWQ